MNNNINCNITLQNSSNKPYQWAYHCTKNNQILCSGSIYYSRCNNSSDALKEVQRELFLRDIDTTNVIFHVK